MGATGAGGSWRRVTEVFDFAAERLALLPELIKKIFERGIVAQPAVERGGADVTGDGRFLFIRASDTEGGFDDVFGVRHTELGLIAPEDPGEVSRIGGQPTFRIAEADAEHAEVLELGRTLF